MIAADTLTMAPVLGHRVQVDARKGQHHRLRAYGTVVDVVGRNGYTVLIDLPAAHPNAARRLCIVGTRRLTLLDRHATLSRRVTDLVSARAEMVGARGVEHYSFVI